MRYDLQRYLKRSAPGGWLSMLVGAGWEALKYYDKVGEILPIPSWSLFGIGVLWVILSRQAKGHPKVSSRRSSEVVILRERVTTVERELVVRREA